MSRYIPPGARRGHSSYGYGQQRRTLSDIVDDQVYIVTLKSHHEHSDLPGEVLVEEHDHLSTKKGIKFRVPFQTAKLQEVLKWFHYIGKKDPDAVLTFPPSLNKGQRQQIHQLAQRLRLGTSSEGFGEQRFINVYSVEKARLGVGKVYLTAEEKQKADNIWRLVHKEGNDYLRFSGNEIEEMILADKLDPALKELWEKESLLMAKEFSEKCRVSEDQQK